MPVLFTSGVPAEQRPRKLGVAQLSHCRHGRPLECSGCAAPLKDNWRSSIYRRRADAAGSRYGGAAAPGQGLPLAHLSGQVRVTRITMITLRRSWHSLQAGSGGPAAAPRPCAGSEAPATCPVPRNGSVGAASARLSASACDRFGLTSLPLLQPPPPPLPAAA